MALKQFITLSSGAIAQAMSLKQFITLSSGPIVQAQALIRIFTSSYEATTLICLYRLRAIDQHAA